MLLVLSSSLWAQRYNGFIHSGFSGIIGAKTQPASIAGSPYKYDISFLNGSFYVGNNAFHLDKTLESPSLVRPINGQEKFLHASLELGGLSGFITLPKKQAVGFQYSIRGVGSIRNGSPEIIEQFNRFDLPPFVSTAPMDQQLEMSVGVWQEIGLTYAKVFEEDKVNRWKVGGTLKLVNSYGGAYLDLKDLDLNVDSVTNERNFELIDVQYGYSDNLDAFDFFDGTESFKIPKKTDFSPAFDLGVIYERKLDRRDPSYENGTRYKRDITYAFRLGVSITDIGILRLDHGTASSSFSGILPSGGSVDAAQKLVGIGSVRDLTDSLATVALSSQNIGSFSMALPTQLHINYDHNLGNHFFINANASIDISTLVPADHRLNYPHSFTVTPRWEKGKRGLYMPFYYDMTGTFHAGLGMRFGMLTLGTQHLGTFISKKPGAGGFFFSINLSKLIANSEKPYCFGGNKKAGL